MQFGGIGGSEALQAVNTIKAAVATGIATRCLKRSGNFTSGLTIMVYYRDTMSYKQVISKFVCGLFGVLEISC